MSPVYSEDQPDKPDKHPVEDQGAHRYAVSQRVLIQMRQEDALIMRKKDFDRYTRSIRNLDAHSSNWIAAAWALIGIAASMAGIAMTVSGQLLIFGIIAFFCGMGATGCLIANRQVNQQRKDVAEELAQEMEEGLVDQGEIVPLLPGEEPPFAPTS